MRMGLSGSPATVPVVSGLPRSLRFASRIAGTRFAWPSGLSRISSTSAAAIGAACCSDRCRLLAHNLQERLFGSFLLLLQLFPPLLSPRETALPTLFLRQLRQVGGDVRRVLGKPACALLEEGPEPPVQKPAGANDPETTPAT
jgi:hypothetical protein